MRPIFDFLGLTAHCVQEGMSVPERQKAYGADVTWVTATEAGFDFLRDNLCYDEASCVQRAFNYAIIDEADSILIDEARIPLVIAGIRETEDAGGPFDKEHSTIRLARFIESLRKNDDYEFDDYARNIYLTEKGLERVEDFLQCRNLYNTENGNFFNW